MTTLTFGDMLAEFLRREPDFGFAATADSVAAGYIADVDKFQSTRYGPLEFADFFQYRYNRTGDDRVKVGGAINSSGQWATTGSNNSNTSDTAYACTGIQPDRIVGWFTEAMRRLTIQTHRALVLGHDLDMELSGVQYWDGTLGGSSATNCAVTKVTSAGNVFSGTQSLFVNLSGADGVCLGEAIRVHPGQQIYTAILARADVGTFTFRLYDVDNTAYLDGDVSTTSEEFVLLERVDTVPAGCEQIRFGFKGTGASDDLYVDTCFGPYELGNTTYDLPTVSDKPYKLKMIRPAEHKVTLADGVYTARSRSFYHDLVPETPQQAGDFIVENFPREAVANKLTFLESAKSYMQGPLWLCLEQQASDLEPITSEASTTTQPLDDVVDYALLVAYEDLSGKNTNDPDWGGRYAKMLAQTAAVVVTNRQQPRIEKGTRNRVGWR